MKLKLITLLLLSTISLSCTNDDNQLIENSNKYNLEIFLQKNQSIIDIYEKIKSNFNYDENISYENNLNNWNNIINNHFNSESTYDLSKINTIISNDNSLIFNLNYSSTFKSILLDILNNENYNIENLENADELNIMNNLIMIYNSTENNKDKKLKDKRTIAFAIGAQYNINTAILYLGAIDIFYKY